MLTEEVQTGQGAQRALTLPAIIVALRLAGGADFLCEH
jgi:hypothetical protein